MNGLADGIRNIAAGLLDYAQDTEPWVRWSESLTALADKVEAREDRITELEEALQDIQQECLVRMYETVGGSEEHRIAVAVYVLARTRAALGAALIRDPIAYDPEPRARRAEAWIRKARPWLQDAYTVYGHLQEELDEIRALLAEADEIDALGGEE